jgi:hypothetical protein
MVRKTKINRKETGCGDVDKTRLVEDRIQVTASANMAMNFRIK